MLLVPDQSTVKIDPFVDGQVTVIADIKDPVSGEKYNKDPRNIAKKAEEYLKSTGVGDTSFWGCLLYTSPSPRDGLLSRMPSSA